MDEHTISLSRKEGLFPKIKIGNGCMDAGIENLKGFDESKSEKIDEDVVDLLPNDPFGMAISISLPSDPFGMGISISLPKDPFGMDINISLPNDPFGMDINLSSTSITGWIEDLESRARGFEIEETSKAKTIEDEKCLAEVNFLWRNSNELESEVGDNDMGYEGYLIPREPLNGVENDFSHNEGGMVSDAIFFALGYLSMKDLLSVERVCKSLRDAVQNDPLLWRNVHIDCPLNGKIKDNDLLQLTNRAQGSLCSLNLVECIKITDTGLKCVLESNPGLTKLSVSGCIRLRVEGLLRNLKVFKSIGVPGIKCLRIGGLFGITNQNLEEFKVLLGTDKGKQSSPHKPRYYGAGQLYLSLDDERSIDIETCPRCQQVRQVYDCPIESCRETLKDVQPCRGCTFCIARCINCGCCLNNSDYEETFCFDLLCLQCCNHLLSSQDRLKFSSKTSCLHQQGGYRVFLCG